MARIFKFKNIENEKHFYPYKYFSIGFFTAIEPSGKKMLAK